MVRTASLDHIGGMICLVRRRKVILDEDLAGLYGVSVGTLNRAVKRHKDRFPEDFAFQLGAAEWENLRCQFGISSWGGRRYPPYAFAEQGVAMLSGLLNSRKAVEANIAIMRTFVKLRRILSSHKDLARRLDQLEQKYDRQFKDVFNAIRQLMCPPEKPRRKIGFISDDRP